MASPHTIIGTLTGLWRVVAGSVIGVFVLLLALMAARTGDWLISGLLFAIFLAIAYFVNNRRKNIVVTKYEGEIN